MAWKTVSSFFERLFAKAQIKVLMVGLDEAGKTTILNSLKPNKLVTSVPTINWIVESLDYKNISFTSWDLFNRHNIRCLYHHLYDDIQALIFVVDCTDHERFDEAKEELHRLLNEDKLREAIVLVFANKLDLPNAIDPNELKDKLNLTNALENRQWHIQPSVATKAKGLREGLTWISEQLSVKK